MLSLRFTAARVIELLKLRWAVVLLNELWTSRRLRAAPSPHLSNGWMPGRTGGLGRMQDLETLPTASFSCSAAAPDDNSSCDSIPAISLATSDLFKLEIFLPALKGSILRLDSSFACRLFSPLVFISPWESGRLYRSRGRSVSEIRAALASWRLCDTHTCMELSLNWTLKFSLPLPSHAELWLSVCCLCTASWDSSEPCVSVQPELCSDLILPLWFVSDASLCLAVISCGQCWFTVAEAVPRFGVGDRFRSWAAVGLQVLLPGQLPCRLLRPFLDLEGTNTGKDLSLCGEMNSLQDYVCMLYMFLYKKYNALKDITSGAECELMPVRSHILSLKSSILRGLAGPDP